MKREPCDEPVECAELQDYLPCIYGRNHLSRHAYSRQERDRRLGALVGIYRSALMRIADEGESECGCEAIGSHACDVRQIARAAIATDAREGERSKG